MDPIRIAYQSYTDQDQAGTYWDHLQKHLDDIVDEGTVVDIIGITPEMPMHIPWKSGVPAGK